jgi:hypothetical protein
VFAPPKKSGRPLNANSCRGRPRAAFRARAGFRPQSRAQGHRRVAVASDRTRTRRYRGLRPRTHTSPTPRRSSRPPRPPAVFHAEAHRKRRRLPRAPAALSPRLPGGSRQSRS